MIDYKKLNRTAMWIPTMEMIQAELDKERMDMLIYPHILKMMDVDWVSTSSSCEGHEPRYKAYVYYSVFEKDEDRFIDILYDVCNHFDKPDVCFSITCDYRLDKLVVWYILKFPQELITEITSMVERLISESS